MKASSSFWVICAALITFGAGWLGHARLTDMVADYAASVDTSAFDAAYAMSENMPLVAATTTLIKAAENTPSTAPATAPASQPSD